MILANFITIRSVGGSPLSSKNKSVAAGDNASLISRLLVAFESAKRFDDHGREYWLARGYAEILGYSWEGFKSVVERGTSALREEGACVEEHLRHVSKVSIGGQGARREFGDIELSRRACYLLGINGDPRKKASIASVQQYFVGQTRRQEIAEMLGAAGTDAGRIDARLKLAATEQELREVASSRLTRPEVHLPQIRDAGHEALLAKPVKQIRVDLGVPESRDVMDFADPLIVKATDFATAVTARHVKNDPSLKGVRKIKDVNIESHKGIRGVMANAGVLAGTLPGAGDIREVEHRLERQRAKLVRHNVEGQP
jgi:DNA-damage-inducible protein D